jgi:hypothetical protein
MLQLPARVALSGDVLPLKEDKVLLHYIFICLLFIISLSLTLHTKILPFRSLVKALFVPNEFDSGQP